MKLLPSLLVLSSRTVNGSPELCMVDYEDRLPCSINGPLSYNECTLIGCCYDSNVPEHVPNCYFRNSAKEEADTNLELNAEPLWVTSGHYSSKKTGSKSGEIKELVQDDVPLEPVSGPVLTMEQLDELMLSGQTLEITGPVNDLKKCEIPVEFDRTKLTRCGRRGVPRKRCEEIDCCWNSSWRPGGAKGPRCFHYDIDLEHYGKPRQREYPNMLNVPPVKPITVNEHKLGTTLNLLENKKEEIKQALAECKPNHNALKCIQGPEERQRCDIKVELGLGIKPCDACMLKGCCFDPMPKIVGSSIMPLCFKTGPLADMVDLGIKPDEIIPPGVNISDDEDDEEPAGLPLGIHLTIKPIHHHEDVVDDMELENFPKNPNSIVDFRPSTSGSDFAQMDRQIDQLGQNELNAFKPDLVDLSVATIHGDGKSGELDQMAQLAKNILKDRNPEWAQVLNSASATSAPATETVTVDALERLRQMKEMFSNPIKPGSPNISFTTTGQPAAATTTAASTTSNNHSVRVYTKPVLSDIIDLDKLYPKELTDGPIKILQPGELENDKKQIVEHRLEQLRRVYKQANMDDFKIELELSKKRVMLEAQMGIMTQTQITRLTTTTSTTTTTTSRTTTPTYPTRPGRRVPSDLPSFITPQEDTSSQRCYPSDCGLPRVRNKALQKIVGGQWAGSAEYYPWQASLRRSFSDSSKFHPTCGATLISSTWILTAAHCFIRYESTYNIDKRMMEYEISHFLVHFGRYTLNQLEGNAQVRSLDYFVEHPEYRPYGQQENDIAVAKLAGKPVVITSYVSPVCLPKYVPPVGEKLIITGWGSTQDVGHGKEKLKEIILPLASQEVCRNEWGKYFMDGWMCTEPGYLEDACRGDSGGPAVYFDQFSSRFSIIGVTIAGSRTCSTTRGTIKAGVYSNVLFYKDWIDQTTEYGCA